MIFFILLFGFILRLFALSTHDFWFDEAITYHFSKLSISELLKAVATDNNPPFYYLIIHFILKISQNETVLRLPSLTFNLLSIYLLYVLFKKQFGEKTTLIASSLYSISSLSIYVATEARLHSMAAFLLIMLLATYLHFIKNPTLKNSVKITTVSIVTLYTQYYLSLIFVPMTIAIIFKKQKEIIKKWLLILLASISALLPWIIYSAKISHNGCNCPPSTISLPATLASPSINGIGIVTSRYFLSLNPLIVIIFTLAVLLSIIIFIKGVRNAGKISIFYLIPLGIISVLGLFIPVFSPKGFSIYAPLFFLISASGIVKNNRTSYLFYLIIFLLIIVSMIQLLNPFFKGENIKTITKITQQQKEIPIFHTSLSTYYSLNFYTKQKNFMLLKNPLNKETVNLIGGKQENYEKFNKIWFVDYSKWTNPNDYQNIKHSLLLIYKTKKYYFSENYSIYLLEK